MFLHPGEGRLWLFYFRLAVCFTEGQSLVATIPLSRTKVVCDIYCRGRFLSWTFSVVVVAMEARGPHR